MSNDDKVAHLQLRLALVLEHLVERIGASKKALEMLRDEYEADYAMADGCRDIEEVLMFVNDKLWNGALEAMTLPLTKAKAYFGDELKTAVLSHRIEPDELSLALATQTVTDVVSSEHVEIIGADLAEAIHLFANDWVAERMEELPHQDNSGE